MVEHSDQTSQMGDEMDHLQRKIETLEQRVGQYQTLEASIAQSPFGILIADAPDCTIRWANPAALEYRGQTDLPLTGIALDQHSTYWQISLPNGTPYPPEDLPLSRAVLRGETTRDETLIIRSAQGEDRWVSVNAAPIRNPEGAITSGIAILHDITERIKAEEEIRKDENLIRSIYRAAPTGIGVVSNRQLISINDRILEMTGYDRESLIGRNARFLYPSDEDYEYVGREKYRQIQERGTGTVETRWRCKDGHIIDILMSSTPIDPLDLTAGVTFTALDITEMKRIREELKSLNADLELRIAERTYQLAASNKELEAFSYSISHDLRAPLRSISGFVGILLEDYGSKLDDEGQRICAVISKNVNKMGQLIDDLLAFSRLARRENHKNPINMQALVQACYFELTSPADRERIALTVGGLDDCCGDPDMIRQVCLNLLSNAVKFTSKIECPQIEIVCRRDGNCLVYSFKDNGVGFDMRYKDKLFGVFQRLHREDEFEGTGVGLAIVQNVIHRHGGEVGAESEVGKGATFWFSLPD